MSVSRRRVGAVFRKELREYRHNGNIVYAMAVLPLVFLIQPLIQVFTLPSGAAVPLRRAHSLLYMLAIPVLVPAALAAYSVVGERLQGTLEPILSTPVTSRELLLGKALAAFVPSVVVAYAVFALFVAVVAALRSPGRGVRPHPGLRSARPAGVHAAMLWSPRLRRIVRQSDDMSAHLSFRRQLR